MRPTRPTIALAGGALLGAFTGICALVCTAPAETPARGDAAPAKVVAAQRSADKVAFVASSTRIPAAAHASAPGAIALTAPGALTTLPASAPTSRASFDPSGGAARAIVGAPPLGVDAEEIAQAAPAQEVRSLKELRLEDNVQRGISPFQKGVDMSIQVEPATPTNGGPTPFGPAHPVARAK